MLNILRLLTFTSATFISSLLFFSRAGITQDYPICYIITSSGRIVDLTSICINRKQLDQNISVDSANTAIRANVVDDRLTVSSPDKPSNSNVQSVLPDGTEIYADGIQVRPDGTTIDPSAVRQK